jgi:hypothetical protein
MNNLKIRLGFAIASFITHKQSTPVPQSGAKRQINPDQGSYSRFCSEDLRSTGTNPPGNLPSNLLEELPAIIQRAGANAVFAAKEFFEGTLRNPHTQRAYRQT